MTAPDRTSHARRRVRELHRRAPLLWTWAAAFAVLLLLTTCWNLASPPGSGPDEAAHAVKAAAVVRGQLAGTQDERVGASLDIVDGTTIIRSSGATLMRVPAILNSLRVVTVCFAFRPDVPASCSPAFAGPTTLTDVPTTAGLAPPLFYAMTGWPLLVRPGSPGLYGARLLASVVTAAMVAAAVTLAVAARRSAFLLTGVVLAWTPMAMYLPGILNPSSLELASALLLWVSGLLLVSDHPMVGRARGLLPWLAGVAAVTFVLSRQLSPLWFVLIAAVLALVAPPGRLRALVRERPIRIAVAGVAVAGVAAVAWLLRYTPTASAEAAEESLDVSTARAISTAFGRLGDLYLGMVGNFSYDTPAPRAVLWLWTGLLAVLIVLAVVLGSRRLRFALAAAAAVAVVLPPLIEASQVGSVGLVWQGRYTLPLAMGLPILAGFAIDRAAPDVVRGLWPVGRLAVAFASIGHFIALYFALRRFAVGIQGAIWFFPNEPRIFRGQALGNWLPPVPALAIVLLAVLGGAAMAGGLDALVRRDRPPVRRGWLDVPA